MKKIATIVMMIMLLLAACGGGEETGLAATAVSEAPVEGSPGDGGAPLMPEQAGEAEATAAAPAAPTEEGSRGPDEEAATAVPEAVTPGEAPDEEEATAEPATGPLEVTYFTPAQQEGPYYTVEKPADRDNDLLDFAGAAGEPAGQPLTFAGVVYDANGWPVPGITVEIWQTDSSGVYLHPGDPGTESRDPNFQFYGESVTGPDGVYSFRTIVPGPYEPRPRHIHVKVKKDGRELLTTQFYFADELDLQGNEAAMLIDPVPAEDDAGNPILVGERDIILAMPLVER